MKCTLKYLSSAILSMGLFLSCGEIEAPKPYGVIPTEHQLEWQKMEYYMFVHFGPNTFTNVEWGNGKEDPRVFNPSNVDCRQWAATAKAAGMKAIIITAKHHDGFCLWPSKYSTHTVRETLWKDGGGDILKELSDACKEYGLKFGVYLSPWDQNHPAYGTPEYNQIFANTLSEVLSNYGDVFEQWFDGANGEGEDGKKQVYDWDLFHKTVYNDQPHAIIFSDIGPGCRWMGNERGVAGETNWSRLDIEGFGPGLDAPSTDTLNIGNINGKAWVPAETDVSIRPGWFFSPETNDKVKSVEKLMDIYYTSVGRNSNLLLNVPPDRTGRIHVNDSTRLMELRKMIDVTFADNLVEGAIISASETRGKSNKFGVTNLLNDDYDSYWTTDDDVLTASIEVNLQENKTFNRLLLQEYIPLGQRIKKVDVEYWDEVKRDWTWLTEATTIGYKRILRFPSTTTQKIKISVHGLACPILNGIGIYKAPEQLSAPIIERNKDGVVTIRCDVVDPVIYYTTDGSEPTPVSQKYTTAFPLPVGGVIKAIASVDNGQRNSESTIEKFDLAPSKWTVLAPKFTTVDNIIDGNNHSSALLSTKEEPITIDLGEIVTLKGFSYTPVNESNGSSIYRYNLYVSNDGQRWTKLKSNATFNNIKNNPVRQDVVFDKQTDARYIKIEALDLTTTSNAYSVAEIGVITR